MDLVVFTYAPAGLGHLRVTDALRAGLPQNIPSVVLGSDDEKIKNIHRFTTIHPLARKIYEGMIDGPMSFFFTRLYKNYLKKNSGQLYDQVVQALTPYQQPSPENILFVSTHFGIAHQLVAIKDRLQH